MMLMLFTFLAYLGGRNKRIQVYAPLLV